MENLLQFIGRFHPLLVHLPIGILFLAFLFEVLTRYRKFRKLAASIQQMLFWGAAFAWVSVLSGYLLSLEGGYDEQTVNLHQYAGIATAVYAVVLYLLRMNLWVVQMEKKKGRPARLLLFIPLMIFLTITGHLGGSLTHGEEFLTEFASFDRKEEVNPAEKIKNIPDINQAALYNDIVQPVLEAKCYSCHSSKKQKGELRLDAVDLILRGGKHGQIIESGNADSSELFIRLMLPLEDKHHMPPNEKPQLTSAETDLIRLWLNEGANFTRQVKDFQTVTKINQIVQLMIESSQQETWLPSQPAPPAGEEVLAQLKSKGILVMPVAEENNYLMASFVNSRSIEKADLESLIPIKDQLISLNLSNTNIADHDISILTQLDNLTWLYLNHTSVTDSSVHALSGLKKLKYLNLVDTKITDKALPELAELKELKRIYLYQSAVTAEGLKNFSKLLPTVTIDTGSYSLPFLPTDTIEYKSRI